MPFYEQIVTGTLPANLPQYTSTPSSLMVSGTVFLFLQDKFGSPALKLLNALQLSLLLAGNFQPTGTHPIQDHISGLDIDYVSSGTISVNPGAAYVPSLGRNVIVTGSITQAFPIPAPTGTWQHVYLWENNGTPSIQVTGTAPSNPYFGRARTKNADNSMRYLGSLLPDNGGYLHRFATNVVGGSLEMSWLFQNDILPFQLPITYPTGTTIQTTSIAGVIPATGLVDELTLLGVVSAPATTAWVAAIGETILSYVTPTTQSAEMYFRVDNQSASSVTYFFPPGKVKVSGNTIQTQISVGTVSLNVRVKGIRIPRS